jgi:hypothetical protein
MKIVQAILPFIITFFIFFFAKPSDERCKREAVQKLATINVNAAPTEILVQDRVVLKTLWYVPKSDSIKLGHGFFFKVRIKDYRLEEVKSRVK